MTSFEAGDAVWVSITQRARVTLLWLWAPRCHAPLLRLQRFFLLARKQERKWGVPPLVSLLPLYVQGTWESNRSIGCRRFMLSSAIASPC